MKNSALQKNNIWKLIVGIALASASSIAYTYDKSYSPYANRDFPENLYWGDTHVHTSLSFDANLSGNYKIGPEEAYRLARGETITDHQDAPVKLIRPLDFIVVADHAINLGVIQAIWNEDERVMSQPDGKRMLDIVKESRTRRGDFVDLAISASRPPEGTPPIDPSNVIADTWSESMNAADRFNEPGRFTAFIGYEWTSMSQGNNLHRVVVFRDAADRVSTVQPFSMSDSIDPEDLWTYMQDYETNTSGKVLAIPHNGNVSNGMMFSDDTLKREPITADYAQRRARWEPLYEATQIKGDGETHPLLSPDDRFADYETWDTGNVAGSQLKEPWMLQYEYTRSTLKLGLNHEAALGVNPFKMGIIGSSDAHTGMPAMREDNFMGKFAVDEPSLTRSQGVKKFARFDIPNKALAASGYAAVWAKENTRSAIFDAMQRKETYATTGPRMIVRFFGGWDFDDNDHLRPDFAAIGYNKGVPMGGDLSDAPKGKSPHFLIAASKDPDGANLERVQVVKGWLDQAGDMQEKVFDVVLSDNRQVNLDATAQPMASTVQAKTAIYTNNAGAAQLSTVWKDPDFNAKQRAFYYLRVLEIFTPRWTTYDAAAYGFEPPEGVPVEHQERGYTSAIWYTP